MNIFRNMTSAEVNAILARQSAGASVLPPKRPQGGRGIVRAPGSMNKTESRYAAFLELSRQRGDVLWWKFEGITLKIAPDTRLTMDFAVMMADGTIELRDTKGRKGKSYYAEEDSKIKIKVAATMFPFRFFVVWQEKTGGWQMKEVLP